MSITRFTGVSGPGDSRELVEQVTMTDDVGKLAWQRTPELEALTWALCAAGEGGGRGKCDPDYCVCGGNAVATLTALNEAGFGVTANSRKAPDMDALLSAIASCEAWIDRWTSHVGRCEGGDKCTCGRTAVLSEARAAIIE